MVNGVSVANKNPAQTTDTENSVVMKNNRKYVFDILRIFACFMVIINHTNSVIFKNFFPSLSGQASLILFFISKTAVPVFFMISGALLLGKRDSYKTAYGKRAFKILSDIIIFSVIISIVMNESFKEINFDFFISLINKPAFVSYWYLYSYLALMLMLPFLQKLTASLSSKDFMVLLSLLFFFNQILSFCSYLKILPPVSDYFSRNLLSGDMFYFFLGYFICRILPDYTNTSIKKRRTLAISAFVFLTSILFCFYKTSLEFYNNGNFSMSLDNVFNLPIVLCSSALFVFVFFLLKNVTFSERFAKLLTIVSNATFGIYLTHYIIIKETSPILEILKSNMDDFVATLIMDVAVFAIGVICITVLRMIPVIKKLF